MCVCLASLLYTIPSFFPYYRPSFRFDWIRLRTQAPRNSTLRPPPSQLCASLLPPSLVPFNCPLPLSAPPFSFPILPLGLALFAPPRRWMPGSPLLPILGFRFVDCLMSWSRARFVCWAAALLSVDAGDALGVLDCALLRFVSMEFG